jgi:hypothetical protein
MMMAIMEKRITTWTAIKEKRRKITMTITRRHQASATMKKMMIQRNIMEKMIMMPVKKTIIKKMKIAEKREKAEALVLLGKYHSVHAVSVCIHVWIF